MGVGKLEAQKIMSNLKALFHRDPELAKQWGAVCHADYFEKVLLFASGMLTEQNVSAEELSGAKRLKEILLTMADTDGASGPDPSSGLVHDVLAQAKIERARATPVKPEPK